MGDTCDVANKVESNRNRKLTESEAKEVAKHHNLIYHFLNKYRLEVSDNYDLAALGLIDAVKNYDSSLGVAFSSFAMSCMRYRTAKNHRGEEYKRAKYNVIVESLDKKAFETKDGDEVSIEDTLVDTTNPDISEYISAQSQICSNICYLYAHELEIIVMRLLGRQIQEMSSKAKVSDTSIVNRLRKSKKICLSDGFTDKKIRYRVTKLVNHLSSKENFENYIRYLELIEKITGIPIDIKESELYKVITQGRVKITKGLHQNLKEYFGDTLGCRILLR